MAQGRFLLWSVCLVAAWVNWGWFVRDIFRHRHTASCATACPVLALRPEVRWLGLPSIVWGGLYYSALTVLSFAPEPTRGSLLRGLATAGLLVSIWLLYLLRVRLRTHCRGCYVAHGLNLALWLVTVWP